MTSGNAYWRCGRRASYTLPFATKQMSLTLSSLDLLGHQKGTWAWCTSPMSFAESDLILPLSHMCISAMRLILELFTLLARRVSGYNNPPFPDCHFKRKNTCRAMFAHRPSTPGCPRVTRVWYSVRQRRIQTSSSSWSPFLTTDGKSN